METAKFVSVHMANIHLEKSNPFVDIKLDTVISTQYVFQFTLLQIGLIYQLQSFRWNCLYSCHFVLCSEHLICKVVN